MYEPVYSTYCGEIGIEKRRLSVAIALFVTKFTKLKDDKMYWCVNDELLKEEKYKRRKIY